MLVRGTIVNGHESRLGGPVESLQKGDLLRDPLTDRAGEILEIHRREVNFNLGNVPLFQKLRPICIDKGALGPNQPKSRIIASPLQRLLWVKRNSRMPVVTETRLHDLIGQAGVEVMEDIASCEYFVIVMKQPQLIDVAGVAMYCLGPGIFEIPTPQAPVSSDRKASVSEQIHGNSF